MSGSTNQRSANLHLYQNQTQLGSEEDSTGCLKATPRFTIITKTDGESLHCVLHLSQIPLLAACVSFEE
jgi:hypothetical protein